MIRFFRRRPIITLSEQASAPYYIHEAHRACENVLEDFCDRVRDHPVVGQRPELTRICDEAIDALRDVLEAIGKLGCER